LVSHSRRCYSTTAGFGQWILSKEQFDDTASSPIHSWPMQLMFTCSLDLNQHWSGDAFVMLLKIWRMRRTSWKGSDNIASWNVLKYLYSRCQNGIVIFSREWTLNNCTLLCFSEMKRFREDFEAIAYYRLLIHGNTWDEIKSFVCYLYLLLLVFSPYSSGYSLYLCFLVSLAISTTYL